MCACCNLLPYQCSCSDDYGEDQMGDMGYCTRSNADALATLTMNRVDWHKGNANIAKVDTVMPLDHEYVMAHGASGQVPETISPHFTYSKTPVSFTTQLAKLARTLSARWRASRAASGAASKARPIFSQWPSSAAAIALRTTVTPSKRSTSTKTTAPRRNLSCRRKDCSTTTSMTQPTRLRQRMTNKASTARTKRQHSSQ